MLRIVFLFCFISILSACASRTDLPENLQFVHQNQSDETLLSYVKSYMLIGNFTKAKEHFLKINNLTSMPEAMLLSAELKASQNDIIGAQQDFLLAVNHSKASNLNVSPTLLDYFCTHKKWTALDGLVKALQQLSDLSTEQNQQITNIGLCYFRQNKWDEANTLLSYSDARSDTHPLVFLALARISVERKLFAEARRLLAMFETSKVAVTPESLWTSYEVHHALGQHKLAEQTGEMLIALFPGTDQAKLYNTVAKFNQIDSAPRPSHSKNPVFEVNTEVKFHSIKRGETLYQLSKRYNVAIGLLLKWNAQLNVDDIPIGTKIQVSDNR